MSIIIAGQGSSPGATAFAAAKSAVFSSAPAPNRSGLQEPGRVDETKQAAWDLAAILIRSGLDQHAVVAKLQETFPGMDEITALSRYDAGYQRLEKQLGGRASDGTQPIRVDPGFSSPQDAKAFALQKLGELNKGIANYNQSVLGWAEDKAKEIRAEIWTQVYQGFKANRPEASEDEAIAFADSNLKGYLLREGKFDTGNIRSALGALAHAFNLSPWSLIRENENGTLSINQTSLTFGGQTILEIGSPIGQNVDQAA
ncbi:MAG: hypothetical protein O9322_13015 [Beijerinckiaceae bacterium]|nr:hypothetical protein [Beijerinckiaceae bacterium]MCZ8300263.1 hypothetical protein [Beijerinckiaceae bacterium]